MRDIQACAKADLEDSAGRLGKQLLSGAEEEFSTQRPIHESGKDDGGIHTRPADQDGKLTLII